jgi:hypothetical protein
MPGAEYRIRTISTGRGRVLLAAVVVLAAGGLHMAAAGAAPAPNAAFAQLTGYFSRDFLRTKES